MVYVVLSLEMTGVQCSVSSIQNKGKTGLAECFRANKQLTRETKSRQTQMRRQQFVVRTLIFMTQI